MTVKELISALHTFDEDMDAVIETKSGIFEIEEVYAWMHYRGWVMHIVGQEQETQEI